MQYLKITSAPLLLLLAGCFANRYEDTELYRELIDFDIGKRITKPEMSKKTVLQDTKEKKIIWQSSEPAGIQSSEKSKSEAYIIIEQGYITLEDCYKIAAKYNERLAISGEDYLQSIFLKDQAIGSIMPTITLNGNYYQQNPFPPGLFSSSSFFTAFPNKYQYYFTLRQPLFRGLSEFAALRQAKFNIKANREALHHAELMLFLDVANAFYNVLFAEAEVKTREDTVKVEEERLKEVTSRQTLGLALKTEVYLTEAQLKQDEANLVDSKSRTEIAREQLYFLLGQSLGNTPLKDTIEYPVEVEEEKHFENEAIAKRPDIKQMKDQTSAYSEGITIAKAGYFPTIDLTANQLQAPNSYWHYAPFQSDVNWNFTLGLTFPLFNGLTTIAQERTAHSQYRQAQLKEENLKRQAKVEVKSAYDTFKTDTAVITNYQASLKSAEENYRLTLEEYRHGLAINLEVMTANNLLLQARLNLQRQEFQKKLDWLKLQVTQGTLPLPGVKW